MKRQPKLHVDVEPLSEARWKKIDDAVFRALDTDTRPEAERIPASLPPPERRTQRRWRLALVSVGFVAAAAAVFVVTRRPAATEATDPTALARPSHIETGAVRSNIELGFASLDVGPASAITTSGDDAHGFLVVLEKGSVECEVAPRAARPPFVVQSGDVFVRVVGTHFAVTREADGTHVAVTHGVVEVTHAGAKTAVHPGERWPSPAPSSPSSSVPSPSETASVVAPRPSAPAPAAPTDQQLYEQAARLEARDPDGANAIYMKLAARTGPWSANALFAAGRLAAEKGRTAEAKRLLGQYLERYPSGANADDARRLLSGLR